MTDVPAAPQPGWYPDPADAANVRWWDGAAWTTHTGPNPAVVPAVMPAAVVPTATLAVIPVPPGPPQFDPAQQQLQREAAYVPFQNDWAAGPSYAPQQSSSGSANTLAVWLLVFSWIWIGGVSLLGRALLFTLSPQAAVFSGAILAEAVVIALGFADRSKLRERGFTTAPSPWWLLLLAPLLYLILRLVALGRRSLAPLIVLLASGLVFFGILIVVVIAFRNSNAFTF